MWHKFEKLPEQLIRPGSVSKDDLRSWEFNFTESQWDEVLKNRINGCEHFTATYIARSFCQTSVKVGVAWFF